MEIILYDEGTDNYLNIEEISRYLGQRMSKVAIEVRGSPFANLPQDNVADYASKIAGAKIQDVNKQMETEQEPLYGEIEYEKRRILGKTKSFGIIYDGYHLQRLSLETIPIEERHIELVPIIFTNRLFATWDENNQRYHLRTSIYGLPSIISTTGIIEAPAKPREYYLLKQQYDNLGKDPSELKSIFQGRFINYEDSRLTEVVKGYTMQAVFYAATGKPFCDDKGCRLYNAHWQADLIFAQLESGYEFCQYHTEILRKELAR